MNASEPLDYVFGQLDEPRRTECEQEIAAHPALADRIDRLDAAVRLLLDDGESYDPPADLASRTIGLVEHYRRRPRRSVLDLVPSRVPFRWADVAVAAGIFIAALVTLVPAIRNSQAKAGQIGCAFNLQRVGVGLNQYAGANGFYPYVQPVADSAPYAGAFAVLLTDRGYLHDPNLLHCPCGHCAEMPKSLPDYRTLAQIDRQSPRSAPCLNNVSYAYNIGYRHPDTGGPGPIPFDAPGRLPLLADHPDFRGPNRILDGNSPNHGGAGQNVLFADGHVTFHPTRKVGPDSDIYLNAHRQPAPGVHLLDAVLAPGITRFDGR